MKRLLSLLVLLLPLFSFAEPTTRPTKVVAVWWQGQENIEHWVKDLGVNVLWWDSAVHGNAADFPAVHEKVASLRTQGFNVWVIRRPGYALTPAQPVAFDQKYGDQIYAFSVGDEREDKVSGGDLFKSPQPIIASFAAEVSAIHTWMPGVPIVWNANGTHIMPALKDRYVAIVGTGIDYLCSDSYPLCNQQTGSDGRLLYPDVTAEVTNGLKLFKTWFPNKPAWAFVEVCNQGTNTAGAGGWAPGFIFVGSRAAQPGELWSWWRAISQLNGDGIAYFPQARNGAVMDATDPRLVTTIQAISREINPSSRFLTTAPSVIINGVSYVPAKP